MPNAKVISIANQKGGVGKTTTTYNLATSLSRAGKTVLMIDMDPQYSLTESCAMLPDAEEYNGMSTCRLYQKNVDPLDCCFTVDALETTKLFIIPSSQELAVTAKKLFSQTAALKVFKSNITKLREYFDYIFLDCPPSLDELLTSSLISSDGVIIPVKPERLSYAGLKLIMPTIQAIQEAPDNQPNNKELKVIGLIATMYRSQSNEHREHLNKISSEYELMGTIPLSTVVTKGIEFGLPVVVAHPTAKAAKEYNRIAFTL